MDTFREVQSKAQKSGIGIWSIENYAQEDGYDQNTASSPSTKPAPSQKPPTAPAPKPAQVPAQKTQSNIKANQSDIYHVPGGQIMK